MHEIRRQPAAVDPYRLAEFPLVPQAPGPASRYRDVAGRVRTYLASRPGSYSLHFCDLTSGDVWGVAHRRPIFAASTVKVPIVLHAYRRVAAGTLSLTERVAFDPNRHREGGSGMLQHVLAPGETVSVRALARLAITISDNVATQMLLHRLTRSRVTEAMRQMGGRTVYPGGRNVSTAQDMTGYLWHVVAFSRAQPVLGRLFLDDLSHTIYNRRLPRCLPDGVLVAHKVGDWQGVVNDVGIIFHPAAPYLLAVLSEPPSAAEADRVIGRLSRLLFEAQTRRVESEA